MFWTSQILKGLTQIFSFWVIWILQRGCGVFDIDRCPCRSCCHQFLSASYSTNQSHWTGIHDCVFHICAWWEKKLNIKLLAIIHPTLWYRATKSSCCAVGKRFIWWLFTIFSLHLSGSSIFLPQQIAHNPACAPNIFTFGFKTQDGSRKDFDLESRNKWVMYESCGGYINLYYIIIIIHYYLDKASVL